MKIQISLWHCKLLEKSYYLTELKNLKIRVIWASIQWFEQWSHWIRGLPFIPKHSYMGYLLNCFCRFQKLKVMKNLHKVWVWLGNLVHDLLNEIKTYLLLSSIVSKIDFYLFYFPDIIFQSQLLLIWITLFSGGRTNTYLAYTNKRPALCVHLCY